LVPGLAAVTPIVFKPQNAVLTTAFNEDRKSLAAIDPASFGRVAALSDRFFTGGSALSAIAQLQHNQPGVLVNVATAQDLKVAQGDRVQVLLARGTPNQVPVKVRVVGFF